MLLYVRQRKAPPHDTPEEQGTGSFHFRVHGQAYFSDLRSPLLSFVSSDCVYGVPWPLT